MVIFFSSLILIARGGGVSRMMGVAFLLRYGLGWDNSLDLCWPTSLGFARL